MNKQDTATQLRVIARLAWAKSCEIEDFLYEVKREEAHSDPLKALEERNKNYWRAIGFLEALLHDFQRMSDQMINTADDLDFHFPTPQAEADEVF